MKTINKYFSVVCLLLLSFDVLADNIWPTFQGNPQHNGYIATTFDAAQFELNWQVPVGNAKPLNPVTAADGKIFVSVYGYFDSDGLFTLDAETGQTLWSKSYGRVFSVNPPAYDNGKVYIQTGNHGSDTYLRAYNAETGDQFFQLNHGAQWERYFAPTILDGVAYINGGSYGGMYAFDIVNGIQKWFARLAQYDEWTPAVDDKYAYAYVGGRLSVLDKETGDLEYEITDPDFQWRGWSMGLAPVLGGANDVIAIHGGRLIRFDLNLKNVSWNITRNFTGQPSVARGVIYAIDSGALIARDQLTGTLLWSFGVGETLNSSSLIITDSHAFVASSNTTYAINLTSRQTEWSFPKAGHLAIAERTLYIASSDGVLTSINVGTPPDDDLDGIFNANDNCPLIPNSDQADTDNNGVGDACNDENDSDGDEWANHLDNCPNNYNLSQVNVDEDEFGDVCDPYPHDADNLGVCLLTVGQLTISNERLVMENSLLIEQLKDSDSDGVIDQYDTCSNSLSADIDHRGCSNSQFCSTYSKPQTCNNADWNNDSPLEAKDCKWKNNQCNIR